MRAKANIDLSRTMQNCFMQSHRVADDTLVTAWVQLCDGEEKTWAIVFGTTEEDGTYFHESKVAGLAHNSGMSEYDIDWEQPDGWDTRLNIGEDGKLYGDAELAYDFAWQIDMFLHMLELGVIK